MPKFVPAPISSFTQAAVTTINDNLERIQTAFENTLSRDGESPNQMGADLDMNHHDILNVKDISLDGGTLLEFVGRAEAAAEAAEDSEQDALDYSNLSQMWAVNPEDVPVTTSPVRYSAYHWAQKALQSGNFRPDAIVPEIAGRDSYDDEPAGFAVLVSEDSTNDNQPTLYFKLTGDSADWSGPVTFGVSFDPNDFATAEQGAKIDEFPDGVALTYLRRNSDNDEYEALSKGNVLSDLYGDVTNLLHFGAQGDYDPVANSGTNNQSFLNAAIANTPAGGTLLIPSGRYMVNGGLNVSEKEMRIVGMPGTEIIFLDGDGFEFDISDRTWNTMEFRDLKIITRSEAQGVGIKIKGADGSGDGPVPLFENVHIIGADRYYSTGELQLDEFLHGVELEELDRATFRGCVIYGSVRQAIVLDHSTDTRGILADGCTHLVVDNSHIFYQRIPLHLTGHSEGLHFLNSAIVAGRRGIVTENATIDPANAHVISGSHISCTESDIELLDGSIGHAIYGNFFLPRPTGVTYPFTYIKLDGAGTSVYGNHFHSGDVGDVDTRGVELGENASQCKIFGNKFRAVRHPVRKHASATNCDFSNNTVEDNAQTSPHLPIVDYDGNHARDTMYQFGNVMPSRASGHRGQYVLPNTGNHFRASQHQFLSTNGVLGMIMGTGATVNYLAMVGALSGSSPSLEAMGSGTNLSLRLIPKGTGTVFTSSPMQASEYRSIAGDMLLDGISSGFEAATGTENKGAFSTYTAPTISGSYTQSEVQSIANNLQLIHRQVAALKNALMDGKVPRA